MRLRLGALVIVATLVAPPARADWFESGFVNIVANLSPAEAQDIDPGDVIDSVLVGSEFESGTATVVGEGDVTTRQSLGQWTVRNGQGNIQSTFGEGGTFTVATGNFQTLTSPVLEVLNSDIAGNCAAGRQGTLRLIASVIDDLQVGDSGSAYLSMGSRVEILDADSGGPKYLQLDESQIVGRALQSCRLFETTLVARDSLFACANVDLAHGTEAELRPEQTPYSELRIAQALRMDRATLDVGGGIASTGRIEISPTTAELTALRVAATSWVNEGIFAFTRYADGPAELLIGGGSQFLQKGTMTVRSQAGANGVVVTGAGTELDVESDLLVGQSVVGVEQPTVPGTLTVGSGADVIVRGTLVIGASAVLNLEPGGTVYAAATEIHGTVNENGGALVVPEAGSSLCGVASIAAFAWRSRRRRRSRTRAQLVGAFGATLPVRFALYGGKGTSTHERK